VLLLLQANPNLPNIPHVLSFWTLLPPAASAPVTLLLLLLLLLLAHVAPVTQLLQPHTRAQG
jgi:hypothetical protein